MDAKQWIPYLGCLPASTASPALSVQQRPQTRRRNERIDGISDLRRFGNYGGTVREGIVSSVCITVPGRVREAYPRPPNHLLG